MMGIALLVACLCYSYFCNDLFALGEINTTRPTVRKSRPSSNFGVTAPLGPHPQKCGVWLRRWENQRRLSV